MKFIKYFFGDLPDPTEGAPDIRKILNSPDTDAILTAVAEGNDIRDSITAARLTETGVLNAQKQAASVSHAQSSSKKT